MKNILFTIAICFFVQIGFAQKSKNHSKGKYGNGKSHKNHKMENKQLRHVVIFKFKDSASAEDVKKVEVAFGELKTKIKQIVGYEWGLNNSPENLNQGFTHVFFVTFNSEEDRAIYLPHPDHKAFVDLLGPVLEKAMVVDYWAGQ
jgi:predicted ribonuclease toxin of YeeF-YezG toxin-antitoxin module